MKDFFRFMLENLKNKRTRRGQVWRLLICPITAPLFFGGLLLLQLSQLIAHGHFADLS